jgi:cbb3-type cytochrome oxidase maturation protein
MEILVLLIPLSVALALLIAAGFWWSVRSGQFDDLEGPAHRILADDDGIAAPRGTEGAGPRVPPHTLTSINAADPPRGGRRCARYNRAGRGGARCRGGSAGATRAGGRRR